MRSLALIQHTFFLFLLYFAYFPHFSQHSKKIKPNFIYAEEIEIFAVEKRAKLANNFHSLQIEE